MSAVLLRRLSYAAVMLLIATIASAILLSIVPNGVGSNIGKPE